MFRKIYKEYWVDLDEDDKMIASIFYMIFIAGVMLFIYILIKVIF